MEARMRDVERLLRLAGDLRLQEYLELFQRLEAEAEGCDRGEALLSRAQVKLLCADPTFPQDLIAARVLLPSGSRYAPLLKTYAFSEPNSFVVFSATAGSVRQYLDALDASFGLLEELCGKEGLELGRQMQSEILYFSGRFDEALSIVESMSAWGGEPYDRAMMAHYARLRCSLAIGDMAAMEDSLERMIRLTKGRFSSLDSSIYQTIRSWVNLTTGWSGDTPRYTITPEMNIFPALEDRAEAIRKGIHRLGSSEAPFAEYARLTRRNVRTMRDLYIDIYNMLLMYKYSDHEKALELFDTIYPCARGNEMIMPFAEYGKQIVPFLEHAMETKPGIYEKEWMKGLISVSERYEISLSRHRNDDGR